MQDKNYKKGLLALMLLGAALMMGGCASLTSTTYSPKTGQASTVLYSASTDETLTLAVRRVIPVDEAKELDMYKALSKTTSVADLTEPGAFVELCRTKSAFGYYPPGGVGCKVSYVLNKEMRTGVEEDDIVAVLVGRFNHFWGSTRYLPGDVYRAFQIVAKHGPAADACWGLMPLMPSKIVDCDAKASKELADLYFKKYPPTAKD